MKTKTKPKTIYLMYVNDQVVQVCGNKKRAEFELRNWIKCTGENCSMKEDLLYE